MNQKQGELSITVTDDRLAVWLECASAGEDFAAKSAQIQAELQQNHIPLKPDYDRLQEHLRMASAAGQPVVRVLLLAGRAATPSRDGAIEWARDFFSSDFAVDEKTGTIDYRQRVAHTTVQEGEFLARVIPPIDGEEGQDVFGKRILPRKPKKEYIRVGPNVRAEEKADGQYLYAVTTGRIRWTNGLLDVDKVLRINGSVGIETGNINFPQALVITGDVLTGSRIHAGGDIEIHGTVEAADIEAGGDLTVRGGIYGAADKLTKAGGNIHAKFILNARIDAGRDVVVENEIVGSALRCRGAVLVTRGRIVGGVVCAVGGIAAGQVGNDGGMPTRLMAGDDFALATELAAKDKETNRIQAELSKIQRELGPLQAQQQKYLRPAQAERLTELLYEVSEAQVAMDRLQGEIGEMVRLSAARARPQILVNGRLYPETTLRLGAQERRIMESLSGPIRAMISAHGEIELLSAF